MPKSIVLLFIFAWLAALAGALQWGFTYNWSNFSGFIYLAIILGAVTIAALAINNKLKQQKN